MDIFIHALRDRADDAGLSEVDLADSGDLNHRLWTVHVQNRRRGISFKSAHWCKGHRIPRAKKVGQPRTEGRLSWQVLPASCVNLSNRQEY